VIAFFGLVVIAAAALVVTLWSGVTLSADPTALARLETQPFAGSLQSAVAYGPGGQRIPLSVQGGRLTPLAPVKAGELISVEVTVRRPGIIAWALGSTRTEHLTVQAPAAHVQSRWLTVPAGTPVRIAFDQPVSALAYGRAGHLVRQALSGPERTVSVLQQDVAGAIEIEAAVRPWEQLSAPVTVHWFPPAAASSAAVALVRPAPGSRIAPDSSIRVTLSRPVSLVFGSKLPTLDPSIAGSWRQTSAHTLVFTPSGLGAPLFGGVRLVLPRAVTLASATGVSSQSQTEISWSTPAASMLRLQELLAQQGYLPLTWKPAGTGVPRTAAAQLLAAVRPPRGSFSWRYANTPSQLQGLWSQGTANTIIRGAVMMFEHEHGLTVDGIAGPMVWHALLADQLAGRRYATPYCYVFVRQKAPELLTLWCGGQVLLTSPGNTGIASRPTKPGTFPVFERELVGTMSGTNPDGSHYHDPGIRYISYFNGGDAIHEFPRASYGTPQSLGCVELPPQSAAAVWPHTPIGTLVTVEPNS
jgi:peptidoglycan hydrolase-like protein with peptidoglycan-binding domain